MIKSAHGIRRARRALASAAIAAVLAATAHAPLSASILVTDDPALYWSRVVTSTFTGSPVLASRGIAMAQVAIYEAANATSGAAYASYIQAAATGGDPRAAIATAAHKVLVAVNPSRAADYDAALAATLALVPDSAAKTQGIATGNAIGIATIANRAADGATTVFPYSPQAPGTPGAWQPTPPGNLPGAAPQWQNVTPWVMNSPDQFLVAPPPALDSAAYAADFNEVKDIGSVGSATRTAFQGGTATIVASTLGVIPWQDAAIDLAKANGMTTADAARMLAILALGNADTLIAVWDSKYEHDFWRPITAIRNAGIDGNAATDPDASWTSLLTNPNYPSHSSGLSGVAGNASTILASFFGDTNTFCFSGPAGQRCFDSFSAAAQEAANSRIYGGIHFRFETEAGLAQGRSVARFTLANALAPVPEPQTWAMLIIGFGLVGGAMRSRSRVRLRAITLT